MNNNGRKSAKLQKKVEKAEEQIDRLRHRAAIILKLQVVKRFHVLVTEESKRVQLDEEVPQLEHENIELQDKVQEILVEASEKIVTFEGGKYTNDVRACCYELLSLNVSVRNVKAVIESVLRNIAGRQADRLPKQTALCDMMLECLTLAQAQFGEQLSQDDDAHYTLQTDGTTKYGNILLHLILPQLTVHSLLDYGMCSLVQLKIHWKHYWRFWMTWTWSKSKCVVYNNIEIEKHYVGPPCC